MSMSPRWPAPTDVFPCKFTGNGGVQGIPFALRKPREGGAVEPAGLNQAVLGRLKKSPPTDQSLGTWPQGEADTNDFHRKAY